MLFFPVDKRMGEKYKWFPMIKVGKKKNITGGLIPLPEVRIT